MASPLAEGVLGPMRSNSKQLHREARPAAASELFPRLLHCLLEFFPGSSRARAQVLPRLYG